MVDGCVRYIVILVLCEKYLFTVVSIVNTFCGE